MMNNSLKVTALSMLISISSGFAVASDNDQTQQQGLANQNDAVMQQNQDQVRDGDQASQQGAGKQHNAQMKQKQERVRLQTQTQQNNQSEMSAKGSVGKGSGSGKRSSGGNGRQGR